MSNTSLNKKERMLRVHQKYKLIMRMASFLDCSGGLALHNVNKVHHYHSQNVILLRAFDPSKQKRKKVNVEVSSKIVIDIGSRRALPP